MLSSNANACSVCQKRNQHISVHFENKEMFLLHWVMLCSMQTSMFFLYSVLREHRQMAEASKHIQVHATKPTFIMSPVCLINTLLCPYLHMERHTFLSEIDITVVTCSIKIKYIFICDKSVPCSHASLYKYCFNHVFKHSL